MADGFTRTTRATCKRGSVSIITALMALPLLAMVGLAIDAGSCNQVKSTLLVAADAAAMNAVKIASNAEIAGDANYLTKGQQAGQQWFMAATAGFGGSLANASPTVTVTGTTTITAAVAYTAIVPPVFGTLVGQNSGYTISGGTSASATTTGYLDVEIMLDASSSMQVAATITDIENMGYWTSCNIAEAWYGTGPGGTGGYGYNKQSNGYAYSYYTNSAGGKTYNPNFTLGAVPYPTPIPSPASPYASAQFTPTGTNGGPSCQGWNLPVMGANGPAPLGGEPCAFACHSDGSKPAGQGNDYYGLARASIGTSHPVNLRFDVVKLATDAVIQSMQADDLPVRNLDVGVFTFNDQFNQVYPVPGSVCSDGAPSGEACDDWPTALAEVGTPPTQPNGADTGIQAELLTGNASHADTDFSTSMTALGQVLTPSGDGSKPATPRKVLFLITDGIDDTVSGGHKAFDYTQCNNFKQLGYTIFVVYTPYYAYPNYWYLTQVQSINEGTGPGTVAYNLQACSSDPVHDYIAAADLPQLTAALNGFLKSALTAPARFTQ